MQQTDGTISKAALWGGRVLSALPVLLFLFSAGMKLSGQPQAVEGFTKAGYPDGALFWIGVVELLCVIFYVVPQTAILGAILLTGYLGGAIVHHVRLGEPFMMPFFIGVAIWGGLYLRDLRLRTMIPLRRAV